MKLQPLADRIVVEPLSSEEITKGGIVIPGTAQEKPQEGKVIAVGKGKVLENGTVQAPEVKVGDTILYGKYSGAEFKKDGSTLLILREDEILAIIK
jgi:chaperonin GroES